MISGFFLEQALLVQLHTETLNESDIYYKLVLVRKIFWYSGIKKTSWLPANLGRDYYRRQAETHIQDLANKISRLQKEIEDRAGNFLDERDRMIQQLLWLQNELDNVGAG